MISKITMNDMPPKQEFKACFFLTLFSLVLMLLPVTAKATNVRMLTTLGPIDIQLLDGEAPRTVTNFLGYVHSGAYNNTIIHRSVPGFVLQGGGYQWSGSTLTKVTAGSPIVNEFTPTRSNVRGTLAMAKLSGNPDSATNEWFVNLADNSANLDAQNGGFTVFARVSVVGMQVFDAIAALPVGNAGGAFTNLPLATPPTSSLTTANFVIISSVTSTSQMAGAGDADRVFSFLEFAFPNFLSPSKPLAPPAANSETSSGYYYRYYAGSNAYVGVANGSVYYLGPASGYQLLKIGELANLLSQAASSGY